MFRTYIHKYTISAHIQYIHTVHTYSTYIQYIHTVHTYSTYIQYIHTVHTYVSIIHTCTYCWCTHSVHYICALLQCKKTQLHITHIKLYMYIRTYVHNRPEPVPPTYVAPLCNSPPQLHGVLVLRVEEVRRLLGTNCLSTIIANIEH